MASSRGTKRKHSDMVEDISRIIGNPRFSDVTVKCKDRTWKLHRVIICKSDFFDRECEASNDGVIELHDDNPDLVEVVIAYLYNGEYNVQDNLNIQTALSVHSLAIKYELLKLRQLAAEQFTRAFDFVHTGADRRHPDQNMKEKALEVSKLVKILYQKHYISQAQFRKQIVAWVVKHGELLLGPGNDGTFVELGETYPAFAMDLLAEAFQDRRPVPRDTEAVQTRLGGRSLGRDSTYKFWCYQCRDCNFRFVRALIMDAYECKACHRKYEASEWRSKDWVMEVEVDGSPLATR